MTRDVAVLAVLLMVVAGAAWAVGASRHSEALRLQQAAVDSLRAEAEAAKVYADQMSAAAAAKRDTVLVRIPRWRTRVDTLRLSDTVQVRSALVEADSVMFACERALDSCDGALAAKDSALAAEARRAERLEAYRDELAGRLRREALLGNLKGATGVLLTAGACVLLR